jgi:hypothetical protein
MKKKNPKLRLSSETIYILNASSAKEAAGGIFTDDCTPEPSHAPCTIGPGCGYTGNYKCR